MGHLNCLGLLLGGVYSKMKRIILIISMIQIFLLVNFVVAQSYSIGEFESSFNERIILENVKELAKVSMNFLIGFLSIKQIGFVSATYNNPFQEHPMTNYLDT